MQRANRKRNRAVTVRMNDREYDRMQKKIAESGLSQQAYIISAVCSYPITSSDEVAELKNISRTFADFERQIRGIATNVNQMAHVANGQGYLSGETILLGLSDQVGIMRKDGEDVWQSIRSSINQQKVTAL